MQIYIPIHIILASTKPSLYPIPSQSRHRKRMVDVAVKKGLDVLCITDHDEIEGALRAQRYSRKEGLETDVVVGEEVTTADGQVLGLFLQERIPLGLSAVETIDLIHGQGGLAVAPHPFSYLCPSLGKKIEELSLDGVEVLNAAHRDPYVNMLAQMETGWCFAHTGGSDAHTSKMLGDAFTEFPGKSADELYRAIKRKETNPGGGPAPLRHWIFWTMDVAHGVFKKLIVPFRWVECSQNDPLGRVYQMRRRNKVIAIGGCIAFMATPLPFVCGMVGEGWIRWKGRRKWQEVCSEWIIDA